MSAGYPLDEVECPRCQGNGEVETWGDVFCEGWVRCWECGGAGTFEVCANCLDDVLGCPVCRPPASDIASPSDALAAVSPSVEEGAAQ